MLNAITLNKLIMKKLILFSTILALISCNNLEKKQSEPIHASETVLIVNYKLDNMSLEEHAELGSAVAPSFVSENVPGLLGKSFIGDLDRGVFGGVYYFENSESVSVYLESELWKGVLAHPNLVDFKTNVFKTFSGTELANGKHSSRKTSSDQADAENLHILVVNYNYKEAPSDEEMSSQIKEFAPVFSDENFPGMIGKTMINNSEDKVYGGIYYFTSRDAIENYFQSDLWKGFEGDENTDVYKKDIYGVASISTISNGVPVLD